jgi:transposase-like protein
MFYSEDVATRWFEQTLWPEQRCCGHCGSIATSEVPNRKPMPYRCRDCRKYFSVRTGTPIAKTNLPLRKWAVAIYLELTSLKSISSMKLSRDIGVSQPAAWFMLHRIREGWSGLSGNPPFSGPVEVDETYMGGKRRNMSTEKREALTGRGPVGKVAVAGIKDRTTNKVQATVIPDTKSETLCRFIMEHADGPDTKIYTDDALTYHVLPNHETVKHSVGEYVRGKAHTNGVESFWSMLKRAHTGTFHKLSPKHLNRYVQEFAGKHNLREFGTLTQMRRVVLNLVGKRLTYQDLTADNGLSSGARS